VSWYCVGSQQDIAKGEEVIDLPTAKKAHSIDDLAEKLVKAKLAVMTDYRGLTVSQIGELRKQLRPLDVEYEVSKNTLVAKAAAKAGVHVLAKPQEGPTAIAFCYGDIVAPSKVLGDFARTSKIMTVKGGLLGKKLIGPADVARLATMPSKEVLIARLLGSMQSPMVNLVSVLNGPVRGLAYVLQARVKQLEETAISA
jgi:large subunit ribosomal protein L10